MASTSRSPAPSSRDARNRMVRQRTRDTEVERALRSQLHRMGLRFRIHRRPLTGLRREADIVFPSARVAVFVDGCFWHGCSTHGTWPRANAEWWRRKIEKNIARDRDTDLKLREAGWQPIRVWAHEQPDRAAARVAEVIRRRRQLKALSEADA